jgi:hypothetical protein
MRRIIEDAMRDGGIYQDFLDQLRHKLGPELLEALCGVLQGKTGALHPDVGDRLRGAGVLRGNPGAYRIPYPLYESYFKQICARAP